MKYSRTAIGLLTAQYRSVLKKCLLINLGLYALGAVAATPANATNVSSWDELKDGLQAGSDMVMTGDITVSESLEVTGKANTLNMGKHVLSGNSGNTEGFSIFGGSLTLTGGGTVSGFYRPDTTPVSVSGNEYGIIDLRNDATLTMTDGDWTFSGNTSGVGSINALNSSISANVDKIVFENNISNAQSAGFRHQVSDNAYSETYATITANEIKFDNNEIKTVDSIPTEEDKTAVVGSGAAVMNSGGTLSLLGATNTFTNNEMNAEIDSSRAYKVGGGAVINQSHQMKNGPAIDSTMVIGKADGSSVNTFSGNTSSTNGGAIMNRAVDKDGNATLTINGATTFSKNSATQNGGAIYNIQQTGRTATLNLNNGSSTFTGNETVEKGGAIYNAGSMTLDHATFTKNSATGIERNHEGRGGAIYNTGVEEIWSKPSDWGASSNGVMNISNTNFGVENDATSGNSALQGGAIFNNAANDSAGQMTLTNVNFYNNKAFADTDGSDGYASTLGGAVYNKGNMIINEDVVFKGNEAEGYNVEGGAIYNAADSLSDNELVFNNKATFISNIATDKNSGNGAYGGAISTASYSKTTFKDLATFTGNKAIATSVNKRWKLIDNTPTQVDVPTKSEGGALRNAGTVVFENGASFSGNEATYGAAIFNRGTVNLTDASFTNNKAGDEGGAIFTYGGTVNINAVNKDVVFSGNTANGQANDITSYGGTVNFDAAASRNITLEGIQGPGGTVNKKGAGTLEISEYIANQTVNVNSGELHLTTGVDNLYNSTVTVASGAIINTIDDVINDYSESINLADGAKVKGDLNFTEGTADKYAASSGVIKYMVSHLMGAASNGSKTIQVAGAGSTIDISQAIFDSDTGMTFASSGSADGKIIVNGIAGGLEAAADASKDVSYIQYNLTDDEAINTAKEIKDNFVLNGDGIEADDKGVTLNADLGVANGADLTLNSLKLDGSAALNNAERGTLRINNSKVGVAVNNAGTLYSDPTTYEDTTVTNTGYASFDKDTFKNSILANSNTVDLKNGVKFINGAKITGNGTTNLVSGETVFADTANSNTINLAGGTFTGTIVNTGIVNAQNGVIDAITGVVTGGNLYVDADLTAATNKMDTFGSGTTGTIKKVNLLSSEYGTADSVELTGDFASDVTVDGFSYYTKKEVADGKLKFSDKLVNTSGMTKALNEKTDLVSQDAATSPTKQAKVDVKATGTDDPAITLKVKEGSGLEETAGITITGKTGEATKGTVAVNGGLIANDGLTIGDYGITSAGDATVSSLKIGTANKISSFDDTLTITSGGVLGVNSIAQNKVTGLTDALDAKQDEISPWDGLAFGTGTGNTNKLSVDFVANDGLKLAGDTEGTKKLTVDYNKVQSKLTSTNKLAFDAIDFTAAQTALLNKTVVTAIGGTSGEGAATDDQLPTALAVASSLSTKLNTGDVITYDASGTPSGNQVYSATSIKDAIGKANTALQTHQTVTLQAGDTAGSFKLTTAAGISGDVVINGWSNKQDKLTNGAGLKFGTDAATANTLSVDTGAGLTIANGKVTTNLLDNGGLATTTGEGGGKLYVVTDGVTITKDANGLKVNKITKANLDGTIDQSQVANLVNDLAAKVDEGKILIETGETQANANIYSEGKANATFAKLNNATQTITAGTVNATDVSATNITATSIKVGTNDVLTVADKLTGTIADATAGTGVGLVSANQVKAYAVSDVKLSTGEGTANDGTITFTRNGTDEVVDIKGWNKKQDKLSVGQGINIADNNTVSVKLATGITPEQTKNLSGLALSNDGLAVNLAEFNPTTQGDTDAHINAWAATNAEKIANVGTTAAVMGAKLGIFYNDLYKGTNKFAGEQQFGTWSADATPVFTPAASISNTGAAKFASLKLGAYAAEAPVVSSISTTVRAAAPAEPDPSVEYADDVTLVTEKAVRTAVDNAVSTKYNFSAIDNGGTAATADTAVYSKDKSDELMGELLNKTSTSTTTAGASMMLENSGAEFKATGSNGDTGGYYNSLSVSSGAAGIVLNARPTGTTGQGTTFEVNSDGVFYNDNEVLTTADKLDGAISAESTTAQNGLVSADQVKAYAQNATQVQEKANAAADNAVKVNGGIISFYNSTDADNPEATTYTAGAINTKLATKMNTADWTVAESDTSNVRKLNGALIKDGSVAFKAINPDAVITSGELANATAADLDDAHLVTAGAVFAGVNNLFNDKQAWASEVLGYDTARSIASQLEPLGFEAEGEGENAKLGFLQAVKQNRAMFEDVLDPDTQDPTGEKYTVAQSIQKALKDPKQDIVAHSVNTQSLKVAIPAAGAATENVILTAGVDDQGKNVIALNGATTVDGDLTADTLTLPSESTATADTVTVKGIKTAVSADGNDNYLITSGGVNDEFNTKVGKLADGQGATRSVANVIGVNGTTGVLTFNEGSLKNISEGDGNNRAVPTTVVGAIENLSYAMGLIHGLVGTDMTFNGTGSTNLDANNKYIGNLKAGTSVSDDLVSLDNALGAVSTLTTDVKSNIVAAVNDMNNKVVHKAGNETVTGMKTFSNGLKVGADWTVTENSGALTAQINEKDTLSLTNRTFKLAEGDNEYLYTTPNVFRVGSKTSPYLEAKKGAFTLKNADGTSYLTAGNGSLKLTKSGAEILSVSDNVLNYGNGIMNVSNGSFSLGKNGTNYLTANETFLRFNNNKFVVDNTGNVTAAGRVRAASLTFDGATTVNAIVAPADASAPTVDEQTIATKAYADTKISKDAISTAWPTDVANLSDEKVTSEKLVYNSIHGDGTADSTVSFGDRANTVNIGQEGKAVNIKGATTLDKLKFSGDGDSAIAASGIKNVVEDNTDGKNYLVTSKAVYDKTGDANFTAGNYIAAGDNLTQAAQHLDTKVFADIHGTGDATTPAGKVVIGDLAKKTYIGNDNQYIHVNGVTKATVIGNDDYFVKVDSDEGKTTFKDASGDKVVVKGSEVIAKNAAGDKSVYGAASMILNGSHAVTGIDAPKDPNNITDEEKLLATKGSITNLLAADNIWTGSNTFEQGIKIGADYKIDENDLSQLIIRDASNAKPVLLLNKTGQFSLYKYAEGTNNPYLEAENGSFILRADGKQYLNVQDGSITLRKGGNKKYLEADSTSFNLYPDVNNNIPTFSVENATGNTTIKGDLTAGDKAKAYLDVDNAKHSVTVTTKKGDNNISGFEADGDTAAMVATDGTNNYGVVADIEGTDKSVFVGVTKEGGENDDTLVAGMEVADNGVGMGVGDENGELVAGFSVEKKAANAEAGTPATNTIEMGAYTIDASDPENVQSTFTTGVSVDSAAKTVTIAANDKKVVTVNENGMKVVGDVTVGTTDTTSGALTKGVQLSKDGTVVAKDVDGNTGTYSSNEIKLHNADSDKDVFSVDVNGKTTTTTLAFTGDNGTNFVEAIDNGTVDQKLNTDGTFKDGQQTTMATVATVLHNAANGAYTAGDQSSWRDPYATGGADTKPTTIADALDRLATNLDAATNDLGDWSKLSDHVKATDYAGNINKTTGETPYSKPSAVSAIIDLDDAIGKRSAYKNTHYANATADVIPVADAIKNLDTAVYQDIHGKGKITTDPETGEEVLNAAGKVKVGDLAKITEIGNENQYIHVNGKTGATAIGTDDYKVKIDSANGVTTFNAGGDKTDKVQIAGGTITAKDADNESTYRADGITVNTDKFTVDANGNTVAAGSLTAAGGAFNVTPADNTDPDAPVPAQLTMNGNAQINGDENVTGKITVAASEEALNKVIIDSADGSVLTTSGEGENLKTVKLVNGTATASETVTAGTVDTTGESPVLTNGVQLSKDGSITAKAAADDTLFTVDTNGNTTTKANLSADANGFTVTHDAGKDQTQVTVAGDVDTQSLTMADAKAGEPKATVTAIDTAKEPQVLANYAVTDVQKATLATVGTVLNSAENAIYRPIDDLKGESKNYATAGSHTLNEAIANIDKRIGDFAQLHKDTADPTKLSKNLTYNGTIPATGESTVVDMFNGIDSTLGTIHGLAESLGDDYQGNLDEGDTSSVEKHLAAIDTAIGDRRDYTAQYNIKNNQSVAESLDAMDLRMGDVASLGREMHYYSDPNPANVNLSSAVKSLDSNLYRLEMDHKKLRHETHAGLASAAALSALVPNPRGTGDTTLSFGTGAYQGHTAAAFGGFHWITNNLLVNAGVGWDNREATTRIGVSYSF